MLSPYSIATIFSFPLLMPWDVVFLGDAMCQPFLGSMRGFSCVTMLWYLVCAILEIWFGAVSPQAHAVFKVKQTVSARSRLVTDHCLLNYWLSFIWMPQSR